jgi:hypothetical protein
MSFLVRFTSADGSLYVSNNISIRSVFWSPAPPSITFASCSFMILSTNRSNRCNADTSFFPYIAREIKHLHQRTQHIPDTQLPGQLQTHFNQHVRESPQPHSHSRSTACSLPFCTPCCSSTSSARYSNRMAFLPSSSALPFPQAPQPV